MQSVPRRRLFGGALRGPRIAPPEGSVEALRKARLKVTQPRLALLSVLGQQAGPATVEALHAAVGSSDLVTVYRSLTAFAEIGLVRRSFNRGGAVCYELSLGRPRQYHVTCKETGRVIDLDEESTRLLQTALEAAHQAIWRAGGSEVEHALEFHAVLPKPSAASALASPAGPADAATTP
jgi:Fe2+ or Zn2+ uptake regulation protein